ncbi:hypothetical protein [Prauserella endophytica]|uniref:DUF1127 domain-containing protein n=1 Tax=Prauserella endophytica TaxID=1592324 RepID=A0ABY2RZE2_9PSEU|nr:hypothetical protein [Prauserella endophytica]TKG66256.1 hypothetical protein FCN18_25830 [Prauserella endophytica]
MPVRQRPIGALLDLVFGNARVPGGGPRWITLPPWPWFCHYCDTNAQGGDSPFADFASARIQRTRIGRRIVWHPYEWRHDLEDLGLTQDERDRAQAAVRHHVSGPGAAVTWDIQRQKLQIVRAPQIDWRKA